MPESTRVDPATVKWEGPDELRGNLERMSRIVPNPKNLYRKDRAAHIEQLAASLTRWGQVRPILVEPLDDHGNLQIVAGHHLHLAAKNLGWNSMAVTTNHFEAEAESDAYRIADNMLAQREGKDISDNVMALDGFEDLSGTGVTEEDLEDSKAYLHRVTEYVHYTKLKVHPDNYREHPEEQIEHLIKSLDDNGFYRNIVASEDGFILAGHGIYIAARRKGINRLPTTILACAWDDPQAQKVIAADNEIAKMAETDDRKLSENLRRLQEGDASGLIGTGYDAMQLANLILTTRPQSEIEDHNHAAEWVGMGADFEVPDRPDQLLISFETPEQRDEFCDKFEIEPHVKGTQHTWSAWWPTRERQDLSSVYFDADGEIPGQTTVDDFVDTEGELREAAERAEQAAENAPGPLAAAPHRAMARTAKALADEKAAQDG